MDTFLLLLLISIFIVGVLKQMVFSEYSNLNLDEEANENVMDS